MSHQETRKKHNKIFVIAFEIKRIAREMLDLQPEINTPKDGVIAHMMAKSYKTFGSVIRECKAGHGEDGQILARSIFDSHLIAGTVAKDDTEDTAIQFLNFDEIHRVSLYRKIKEKPKYKAYMEHRAKNPKPSDEPMQDVEERASELLKKYGDDYKRKWHANQTTGQIAEGIGFKDLYDTAYDMQSQFTHSLPRSGEAYIRDDGSRLWMVYEPSDNQVGICLASAYTNFVNIVQIFDKHFHLEFNSRIQESMKNYVEVVGAKKDDELMPSQ